MIGNYGTLIQFVAAIYVTLSFDTWLFKSLWSMSYAKAITERIKDFVNSTASIEKQLIESVNSNAASIEKKSRFRGFFCLLYCCATLWYIGYEQSCLPSGSDLEVINAFHLSFAAFTILSVLGYIAICIWATRMLHAFSVCIGWIGVFLILNLFDLSSCLEVEWVHYIVKHLNLYCSILIVIPLVYQVILTWLYADNYYYVLSEKIKTEYDDYQRALSATNIDECPNSYKLSLGKAYFDSKQDNSVDAGVTNITSTFRDRMVEAVKIPNFFSLVSYAFRHIVERRVDALNVIEPSTTVKGETLKVNADGKSNRQDVNSFKNKTTKRETLRRNPKARPAEKKG